MVDSNGLLGVVDIHTRGSPSPQPSVQKPTNRQHNGYSANKSSMTTCDCITALCRPFCTPYVVT